MRITWLVISTISLYAHFVECEIAHICGDWPLVLQCSDVQQISMQEITFEEVSSEDLCSKTNPLRSIDQILPLNCSMEILTASAKQFCNGMSTCGLSRQKLTNWECSWPHDTKIKILFTCTPKFICPGQISGEPTKQYTKNSRNRPGAWVRDPLWHTDAVFVLPWSKHGESRTLYEYPSIERFKVSWPFIKYHLPSSAASTSMVVCNGDLYYIKHQTRIIVKYNLKRRQKVKENELPHAYYNGEASYLVNDGGGSDIDLALDEVGLWAIYSTLEYEGNVVISLINTHGHDLSVVKTWSTNVKKSSLINCFAICGEIFMINRNREVFQKYQTALDRIVEIPTQSIVTLPSIDITSINYSPRDNNLYTWSLEQAVVLAFDFNRKPSRVTTVEYTNSFHRNYSAGSVGKARVTVNITSTVKFSAKIVAHYTTISAAINNASCSKIRQNFVMFPSVNANTKVMVSCPNNYKNFMFWKCISDGNNKAMWDPEGPDFKECLENSNIFTQEDILVTANSLKSAINSSSAISSNDIQLASKMLRNIAQMKSNNASGNPATQSDIYSTIYDTILETGEVLMDKNLTGPWSRMKPVEKSTTFNNIIETIKKSGFRYADDLVAKNKPSKKIIFDKESVFVTVQVLNMNETLTETVAFKGGNNGNTVEDLVELSSLDIKNNEENGQTKVVFALYKTFESLWNSPNDSLASTQVINSHIVSLSLKDDDRKVQLLKPVKITLKHRKKTSNRNICVYWKPGNMSSPGIWDIEGCHLVESNLTHTQCECNHLTSFAILVNHQNFQQSRTHTVILDFLTWVGLTTSLICLAFSIVTFIYFKSLHCLRTTIHTNLCVCLFVSQLIFLTSIDMYEMELFCSVVAGVLHYTFLATFTWMALEGFQLYVMLVEVFERFTSVVFYYAVGYGLPLLFVAVSAAINPNGYGTDSSCWLSTEIGGNVGGLMPFIWAFIGPASFVAMANIFFLLLTAVTIYTHARKYIYYSKLQAARSSLAGTCALLCLLGSTWIFGMIWWWKQIVIVEYFFCILNAFQGVYIFLFHCILHNKVRYEYRKCLSQVFGEKYFDVSNSTTLTMKYSGNRRRSSHTHYPQKWKGHNGASVKTSMYEKHTSVKAMSRRRKSAPHIDCRKHDYDPVATQAIVTRKNSITYLHKRTNSMVSRPDTHNINKTDCKAFFTQRHYSLDHHPFTNKNNRNGATVSVETNKNSSRHSMISISKSYRNLVKDPTSIKRSLDDSSVLIDKTRSLNNLLSENDISSPLLLSKSLSAIEGNI